MQEGAVKIFCLTIGLRVAYRSEVLLDAEVLAPSLKWVLGKLSPIVRDDYLRYAKTTDNAFSKKFWNVQP